MKTRIQWIERHCNLFALLSDNEVKMVAEWADVLMLRGWNWDEMCQASEWVAIHAPPLARAHHLNVLSQRLATIRQQKMAAEVPGEDERGTCAICRGAGLAIVPNPRPDPLNSGRTYTMAVACSCALGRWKEQHCFGERGILSLAQYERGNPDWRQQMADRDESLRLEAKTNATARWLDETLGLIQVRRQLAKAN